MLSTSRVPRVLRAPQVLDALAALALVLVCLVASCVAAPALAQTQPQPPEAARRYQRELTRAAHTQWGLDAPIAALAAQVHQESAWRTDAISHVGASGLAQFMPATAAWWCQRMGTPPTECVPTNPTWALRSLVEYDKFLFDRTPSRMSEFDRFWLAMRGYNGGEGHWRAEAKTTGVDAPTRVQIDAACGHAKRHPSHCPENISYPARILGVHQHRYVGWGRAITPGQP